MHTRADHRRRGRRVAAGPPRLRPLRDQLLAGLRARALHLLGRLLLRALHHRQLPRRRRGRAGRHQHLAPRRVHHARGRQLPARGRRRAEPPRLLQQRVLAWLAWRWGSRAPPAEQPSLHDLQPPPAAAAGCLPALPGCGPAATRLLGHLHFVTSNPHPLQLRGACLPCRGVDQQQPALSALSTPSPTSLKWTACGMCMISSTCSAFGAAVWGSQVMRSTWCVYAGLGVCGVRCRSFMGSPMSAAQA